MQLFSTIPSVLFNFLLFLLFAQRQAKFVSEQQEVVTKLTRLHHKVH